LIEIPELISPSEYSKQELDDILVQCSLSTGFHSQFFFPEIFYTPVNSLQKQIIDLVDGGAKKIAIAAPRALGKTSTMLFGVASKHILFRTKKFIVYLSNSHDNAVLQTENLKHELIANDTVRKFFGPINAKSADVVDDRFSKKSWVTNGGTLIFPRGWKQQIRGILYHGHRPDLIVIDDFEDKDEIQNDEIRAKMKERFHSDVMKITSRFDNDYQFIYIDTLKHEDSLLQDLLDSDEWESIRLDVCDDDYNSNAPEFMTTEEIKAEVASHRKNGTLDVFYREMRNLPISTEDAVFASENFRYYREMGSYLEIAKSSNEVKVERRSKLNKEFKLSDIHSNRIRDYEVLNMIIVDPAKTVKLQSADSAIMCIGVHKESQRIFIRDTLSDKLYPDQLFSAMFDMVRKWNARVLGVEVTGLEEFIVQPILNEMQFRNVTVMFEKLKARGKKEDRIAQVAPYYRNHYLYHNIETCSKLEGQLLSFPRSKLWDLMDCLAYFIPLVDKLSWMFDPAGDEMDEGSPESEYRELMDEPTESFAQLI